MTSTTTTTTTTTPPPPPPPSPPPPPPQPPQPEQLPTPRHDFYTTPNLVWCQGARGRHASFGKWLSKLLVKTGSKALNTRKTEKKNDVNLLFGLLQSTCFNLQLQLNGCFYFGLNPPKKGPFWKECSSSNHWFCRGQVSFSSEYIFIPDKSSLVKLHFVSKNRPHPQWSFGCFAFRVVAFFQGDISSLGESSSLGKSSLLNGIIAICLSKSHHWSSGFLFFISYRL